MRLAVALSTHVSCQCPSPSRRWIMDLAVRAAVPKERPKLTMVCGARCPDQAEHEELEKEIESIWSMVHKAGPSPTEPDLTVLAGCGARRQRCGERPVAAKRAEACGRANRAPRSGVTTA